MICRSAPSRPRVSLPQLFSLLHGLAEHRPLFALQALELRRHEGAGVITRTDQHLAGQGDLESGRLQGRVGFLLGLQRVAQIRLTHFDLGDGLAAQDPRRGQLLDNGQGVFMVFLETGLQKRA